MLDQIPSFLAPPETGFGGGLTGFLSPGAAGLTGSALGGLFGFGGGGGGSLSSLVLTVSGSGGAGFDSS